MTQYPQRMSGGVGPTCNDISFHEHESSYPSLKNIQKPTITTTTAPRKAGFPSIHHLNALAVIIVFSASGMVSPQDFAFVVFSIIYMYFISKVAFPTLHPAEKEPTVFNPQNKILPFYVLTGAIVGLLLPIAYIIEGIFLGDKEGIKAAAPHVFLLASQVFMEGIAFSGRFSIPIRVFVPVFYNSRRIFTIVDWLRNEISKVDEQLSKSTRRHYIGTGLAIVNMAFWSFNIFGFLLPIYLPKAFKIYYSGCKVKG
ncbi:Transmembrane protein [Quillaja saponaria]|uniref:Transmembrane protein n=1 Tax=Quillaja saponaria TaxID=32244 RepID=A0AAD7VFP6_QUISA|nr:Transmembrane protein [Quillaja saponaria]